MKDTKQIQHSFYDVAAHDICNRKITGFISQLNSLLIDCFTEAGIKPDLKQIWNWLEDPTSLRNQIMKAANEDAAQFKTQKPKNDILASSSEIADKLVKGLQSCFYLNYQTPGAYTADSVTLDELLLVKKWITLDSDGELIIGSQFKEELKPSYVYEASNTGQAIAESLLTITEEVKKYNELMANLNKPSLNLEESEYITRDGVVKIGAICKARFATEPVH